MSNGRREDAVERKEVECAHYGVNCDVVGFEAKLIADLLRIKRVLQLLQIPT